MMESAASAGAAASSSAMSLSTSTVSLSTESTRNPRRLSVPSRMVIGLDESFAGELESDEEQFLGPMRSRRFPPAVLALQTMMLPQSLRLRNGHPTIRRKLQP